MQSVFSMQNEKQFMTQKSWFAAQNFQAVSDLEISEPNFYFLDENTEAWRGYVTCAQVHTVMGDPESW